MSKNRKIVKADSFALTEAIKSASNFVKATKDTLKSETKVLSYGEKIRRLQSGLGRQLDGIIVAFNRYNDAVTKRMNATGLKVEQVVTPQIRTALIEPYNDYVSKKLGANSIGEAIEKINTERARDLKNYGRSDENIAEINKFYDLKISKYVLPLQYVEAQLNSLVYTKGDRKQIATKSTQVLKIDLKEIVNESNAVVEEQKAKAKFMAQVKREMEKLPSAPTAEELAQQRRLAGIEKAKVTRARKKAEKEAQLQTV